MPDPTPHESEEPQRDFGKMFDLNQSALTKAYIDRFEHAMRTQEAATDDIKAITAEAKEAGIHAKDVAVMKDIAKLLIKDKVVEAREKLERLERISRLVGLPLFT